MGKSPDIVQYRRGIYPLMSKLASRSDDTWTHFSAGSKGEGFSSVFESDTDRLYIHKHIACTLHGATEATRAANKTVLQMENTVPGYYKLRPAYVSKELEELTNALLTPNGHLSAEGFAKYILEKQSKLFEGDYWKVQKMQGPSAPLKRGLFFADNVYAFACADSEEILQDWVSRPRPHQWWLPPSLKQEVVKEVSFLVPLGSKTDTDQNDEWRICFILGEQKLVYSFSQGQMKLYMLLKMTKDAVFKSICDDMSSFVMKNVVFWLSEENAEEDFHIDNLCVMYNKALVKLREAVSTRSLPYFMIPGRNLFQCKIRDDEQEALLMTLDEMIQEGPRSLNRIPKLQGLLERADEETTAQTAGERDKLEKLKLDSVLIYAKDWTLQMTEKEKTTVPWSRKDFRDVVYKMYDLVWPDWKECLLSDAEIVLPVKADMTEEQTRELHEHYLQRQGTVVDLVWPYWKGDWNLPMELNDDTRDRITRCVAAVVLRIHSRLT